MPRVKQRNPEMRDRLLSVAADLLAEKGAAGLTARSLAARAETSARLTFAALADWSDLCPRRRTHKAGRSAIAMELARGSAE